MSFEHKSLILWAAGLAVGLLGAYLWSWQRRKELLKRFLGNAFWAQLSSSASAWRTILRWTCAGLAAILLVLALARPQWGHVLVETKTKGVDVLMALDVSKSMLAEDIKPNRLERAKLAIWDFVQKLEGDPVGLIIFAGQAFLHCPLTVDYDAFRQSLEAAGPDLIENQGTDLAIAIQEAQSLFATEDNFKRLILITDGEDLEGTGLKQAQRSSEEGVIIYTVGVGTPSGELIPTFDEQGKRDYLRDPQGKLVQTKLDASSLEAIATATTGFYTPLGASGEGLERVYEGALARIPKKERLGRMQQVPVERFQWVLAAALGTLCLEALFSNRVRRPRTPKPSES